jgi:DNA-binding MarR family transcriptional regulator
MEGKHLKPELMEQISGNFVDIVPLLQKKLFKSYPLEALPLNLSRTNIELLFAIYEAKRTSVSELCRRMGIARPNMTPLVSKLVDNGLITRSASPQDRRVVQIAILPAGERLWEDIRDSLKSRISENLSPLSIEDLLELQSCMATLKNIADKIPPGK